MNNRETAIMANRQIALLISNGKPEDVIKLKQHLRPIPPQVKHRRTAEAQRLGDLLPDVMANIYSRAKGVLICQ